MEGPVEPRPAATVVVCRDGPGGVELLVLRRSPVNRFAPGFVVFPGGVVEASDADFAEAWFGDRDEEARACVVRELAEETGLVLTSDGLISAPGRLPGSGDLAPPSVRDLPEVARWVAPEFLPKRFDARFFAVEAPPGLAPVPDQVETDRAWWARPGDVLADAQAGHFPLMWPTLKMLEALAECASRAEVLALHVDQVEPMLTDRPQRP